MAKDGTRRGGRRVRAGDKPKALSDKIAEGKDADIMEFHTPELDAADLDLSLIHISGNRTRSALLFHANAITILHCWSYSR